jgi:DNA modification methylase
MADREVLKDVPMSEIKLNPGNPRVNEEAVAQVALSMEKSGYISPIIVDETNTILAGNTRYKALIKMGKDKVPLVIRVIGLTQEQKDRFVLADNKTQEFAEWDWTKLGVFTEDMLKDVGFSTDEMDRILLKTGTGMVPDEVPPLLDIAYVVPGELFKLGEGFLMCGDASVVTDVDKLMQGNKATLCFTSPPYWVGKSYEKQKSEAEVDEFIRQISIGIVAAMRTDESRIVINTGTGFTTSFDKKNKRHTMLLIDKWSNNLRNLGWNLRHVRHWIKAGQLASIGRKADMVDQHCEFIGTFENAEGKEMQFNDIIDTESINMLETFYNKNGAQRGQNKTGMGWAQQGYWDDIRGNAAQTGHEAAFPTELVDRHLLLYTKRGEIVVDVFAGSGSVLIACQRLQRRAYLMEISPLYCGLTLDRFEAFTGTDAVRMHDNKKWKEIKADKK